MSLLDRLLARKILAQVSKANPSETHPVTKQVEFPTDPSKVYLKEAPKGYADTVKKEESPRLEEISPDLASKGEELAQIAQQLRKYKEEDLKKLYNDYMAAQAAFKKSVQYDENLVKLENLVKEVGTNILDLMIQSGDTSFAIYKLRNMFLLVDRELKETTSPTTDTERLEALKQVLSKNLGMEASATLMTEAEKIAEELRQVTIVMNKRLNVFPISEEHRKQGRVKEILAQVSDSLESVLLDLNHKVVNFLIKLHEVYTESDDAVYDLETAGFKQVNNVTPIDMPQQLEKAASNEENIRGRD